MLYIVYYINTYVFIMCDVNVFKRDIQTVTEREKSVKIKKARLSHRSALFDKPLVRKSHSEDLTVEYKPAWYPANAPAEDLSMWKTWNLKKA